MSIRFFGLSKIMIKIFSKLLTRVLVHDKLTMLAISNQKC